MENKIKRIPIARCPNPDCSRTLLFSCDPKDKLRITTKIADVSYQGKTMICSRCKTIVAIIEKPKVARGYVAIPITGTVQCWPKTARTIESDLSSHQWTWEVRVSIRRYRRAYLCFSSDAHFSFLCRGGRYKFLFKSFIQNRIDTPRLRYLHEPKF